MKQVKTEIRDTAETYRQKDKSSTAPKIPESAVSDSEKKADKLQSLYTLVLTKFKNMILNPRPLRLVIAKKIIKVFKIGSYEQRLHLGVVDRPHYGHVVYNAAKLAKKLGHDRISVLEFGVAGGNGLVNLEYHAEEISKLFSIEIDIYGFDSGEGLPKPVDYRDIPYQWKEGFYKMDVPKLQSRLKKAKLVLGDIKDTSKSFFTQYNPAPIGAILYDFDFYSSTSAALTMLDAGEQYYLPRVFCYFDDTVGAEMHLLNDYTGDRLAISKFNEIHEHTKLTVPYYLLAKVPEEWFNRIWICHFFQHSQYNNFISEDNQNLPLRDDQTRSFLN